MVLKRILHSWSPYGSLDTYIGLMGYSDYYGWNDEYGQNGHNGSKITWNILSKKKMEKIDRPHLPPYQNPLKRQKHIWYVLE